MLLLISYGEILTTLFMRFKSRDPVICIFITWSCDYDSNAIDRFYTKNKKYELFLAIRISRNRYGSWISSTCPYPVKFKLVKVANIWIILWSLNRCWKRLKGVFNLKWNFFGKRWDESLLIFRLYKLMFVLLDAGFVDSY